MTAAERAALIADIDRIENDIQKVWPTEIIGVLIRCRAALESKPDIFPRSDWSDEP